MKFSYLDDHDAFSLYRQLAVHALYMPYELLCSHPCGSRQTTVIRERLGVIAIDSLMEM